MSADEREGAGRTQDEAEGADVVEELRSAAREVMASAREGAAQKEAELWERYRELKRRRRES